MKITVKRYSGARRRRNPESRDSPTCNCTSEVRSLTLALRNEVSILYLVGFLVGQIRDDVAFEHLLNQIERIHDLADLRDTAVAKGVKDRDVELHDPVVAALAEEGPDNRRDLVAFGDKDRHLVAHLGIAGVDGLPHLPDLGPAVAVAHMRQDIDRRVGG